MSPARIEWSVAVRSLDSESGDQYVVTPRSDGVLVGVVDGLGHGPEAAVAAKNAVGLIAEHACSFAVAWSDVSFPPWSRRAST